MQALARWVLRHRRLVILGWGVLFLAGVVAAPATINRLTFDFSLPGQPGYETAVKILRSYGLAADQPAYLLVVAAPPGQTVAQDAADRTFAAAQAQVPAARVVGHAQATGAGTLFATADGRARFAFAFGPLQQGFAPAVADPLQAALTKSAPSGSTATLTGLDALASSSTSSGPGVLVETIVGGFGALLVLVVVFASLLALLPLLIAAVSILTTFLVLLCVTYVADVSFVVQFLVSLIGLGVAIDYSLLIVTRWREERAHGLDNHEAVVAAMDHAGRAVVFSGIAVAIGLIALVVLPVPFLRSMGVGGMLIPVVSVTVVITLLPALLGGIGPRVDWPRLRHEHNVSRFWAGWGRLVVRRRWLATVVGVGALVALGASFFGMQIGQAQAASLASSGPAYEGLRAVEDGGVPHGALTPMLVLVNQGQQEQVAGRLRAVPGMAAAFTASGPNANQGGTALVFGVPREETSNGSTIDVVRATRAQLDGSPGVIGIAGVGPGQLDYIAGVYGNVPLVIGFIVLVTFVVLARAFRSLLLPLKAILLNLASLIAAFGGVVLFWQHGFGSKAVFGIEATGAITFWLPIIIFAFLFGLSMDYEVFILARVREEYDTRGSTDDAVVQGLGRTGRLVTSAALILFLAFLSLASGPETDIKVLGTALGFGILLDATVVRMLLVPALVSLFGSWNWYLPSRMRRLLRIPADAAEPGVA